MQLKLMFALLALIALAEEKTEEHTWGYPSDNEAWAKIGEVCLTGMSQSPIDLPAFDSAATRKLMDPVFTPITAMMTDSGHSLKWTLEEGEGKSEIGHKSYGARQFHAHTASEHTTDGAKADIEFHFVHKADDGAYAVIGIMCMAGDSDLEFWSQLEASLEAEVTIDAESLFGSLEMTKYFTYDGSFTTPPCTEGVSWVNIADMCTIPSGLLEKMMAYDSMQSNYRGVQPLNDRTIDGIGPVWNKVTGAQRCHDNNHWQGTRSTLKECEDTCQNSRFMTYVPRGDRNCACQDTCIKTNSRDSNCDLYENSAAAAPGGSAAVSAAAPGSDTVVNTKTNDYHESMSLMVL